MKMVQGVIIINKERCKGCSLCIEACPFSLLQIAVRKVNTKGYPYVEQINETNCIGCSNCAVVCPDGCITVYRKQTN